MVNYFIKNNDQKQLYFQLKKNFEDSCNCFSGVYAIFKKGLCLYVGQSKNLPSRISTHLCGKYEVSDMILVFELYDEDQLNNFENFMINILKPIENVLVDFTSKTNIENIESQLVYEYDYCIKNNIDFDINKIIKSSDKIIGNSKNTLFICNELNLVEMLQEDSVSNIIRTVFKD